jgi:hypothetical protein
MKKGLIFTVDTPIGYRVSLSRDRWRQITRFKRSRPIWARKRRAQVSWKSDVRPGECERQKEYVCEESDDDVVRRGRVIGFERLNFLTPKQRAHR